MKEFKYTIDGKEYHVAIGGVSDDYVADVTVNGETFQVQMEKPEEPEKKKVLEVYDPSQHHYDTDKPAWTEIEPGHFIMANQEELAKYKAKLAE